MQIMGGESGGK